ncbi:MAG: VWA domain-containing protein [Planctomycetaceae bacterium]
MTVVTRPSCGRATTICLALVSALVATRAPAAETARNRRQLAAVAALAERHTADAAKEIVRVGLRGRGVDPAVRSAAVAALRGMAGDAEVGAALVRTFEQEWQRGNADAVSGLALALLPSDDDDVAGAVGRAIDRGVAATVRSVPAVMGIAAAAAGQGGAGVATLRRLSDLECLGSCFAIRRAVVTALASIRDAAAVEVLVGLVGRVRGEVRLDVVRYLAAVSGREPGLDAADWESWWREAKDTFRFPERLVLPGHDAVAAGGSYYGIPLSAQSLVFVIDVSSSMQGERLAAAQRELVEAIEGLDATTRFTVIAFNDRLQAWQDRLVPAKPAAKEAAASFVGSLVAAGRTATCDAIEAAFTYDAEAVFLLSDGEPTAGRLVAPADIVRAVGLANEARCVSVYTIGLMPDAPLAAFLRTLAEMSRGCYRQVDR